MLSNFEKQNIVGQVLPSSSFDLKEGLVEVIGNFYHYQMAVGQELTPNGHYRVKEARGNQLIIEVVNTKG
ncbi:hypothetical protein LNP00_01095 [Fructobacillus sp. M158]|uniref:hypothetical protein n=1 Tax=Fructobacillus parabroussonetiae TaxID=2713174 RepID=UPI00200B1FF8|nr:hypothetical protein [Fructobacillus parabroussonetiae]MCK8616966.1 hypothetical protein [Fructobacillus parabroussonetiae]